MREADHLPTIWDVAASHARSRPAAVALAQEGTVLDYARQHTWAEDVADGLCRCGIGPGHRVAYLGKNSMEMLVTALAAVRIGAVFTPLNWRLAPPELEHMLADCSARLVIADAHYVPLLQGLAPRLPELSCFVSVGRPQGTPWLDFADFRRAEDVRAEAVTAGHRPAADDTAILVYTSGTTGRPKGTMLSHRALQAMAGRTDWPDWALWDPDDVGLFFMPLFHVSGIAWWLRGLFPGCQQVLLPEFEAGAFIAALSRHRVTRTGMVTSAMQMVLQSPELARADLSALKYIYYGASPIAPALLDACMRAFDCGFIQSYGQTEAGGAVVALAPQDHTLEPVPHMRSAGRPLPGVQAKVVDESGAALPADAVGEICLRSPATMSGYLNLPEETAKVLGQDGWLRTGDAGSIDGDGFVYVHDRIKEMIITGGENVYPAEVEGALAAHPGVAGVAVIGVPSPKWGQAVTAVVERKRDAGVLEAELITWARRRIGSYKLPKTVIFVDTLPRNSTGKVLKNELRRLYAGPASAA